MRDKRHVALLEVLIAFALIALCIIPLIYPQVAIVRSEREFVNTVELDHLVNLLFVNRVQKLYEKRIPWSEIESGKDLPVDDAMLQEVGLTRVLPFTGTYRFILDRQKPPKPDKNILSLYNLIFTFVPKREVPGKEKEAYNYKYTVFIERKLNDS